MAIDKVFSAFLALLLLSSPAIQVIRCQSDEEASVSEVIEVADLSLVGDTDHFSAPVISAVCLFPKNPSKLATAGEETELLVGLYNEDDAVVKVTNAHATLHVPFGHLMYSQNLTIRAFSGATVHVSAQATFPYTFYLSKLLRAGSYDLVGRIVYEIDQQLYESVFYNGTIEVVESEGFLTTEFVFLFTLGAALVGLSGLWFYSRIKHYSKKMKRTPKIEVGTRQTETNMDEWLEGTAYAQPVGKDKKKK